MTNNPVFHFFHTPGNLGPLVLRFAVSGIFFYHGAQKTIGWFGGPGWDQTILAWTSTLGLPFLIASAAVIGEVLIALSLFLGFLTRLSGLGVVVIMTGALIVLARGGAGFTDLELPALLCAAGFSLFSMGGGLLSVDRAISRNLLPVVG